LYQQKPRDSEMARNRRRPNPRSRNRDSGPWQDKPELTERLITLHAKNSAREIATKLSAEFHIEISRNQVIGKARRLKLPSREQPKPVPKPRPSRARTVPIVVVPPPLLPLSTQIDRSQLRVATLPIVRQGAELCRWLYYDYPFACCSEPKLEGSSYCVHHDRKVHIPATDYVPMRRRL
jgi:hypothetical protein